MKSTPPFHRSPSLATLLITILILSLLLGQSSQTVRALGSAISLDDSTAPAAITNLVANAGSAPGSIELSWIAPGDDATSGTAAAYVLRYNTSPITENNWGTSIEANGEPVPQPAGSLESMIISGLAPGRIYYFAIKTQDEAANLSPISNSPRAAATASHSIHLPIIVKSLTDVPTVIPETTQVLPETTTQYLSSISSDGSVYTFNQSTPSLDQLAPGDVIVSQSADLAPYGFLRKVTSVSSASGQVIVTTTDATLADAIQSGAAQTNYVLSVDQIQDSNQLQGVSLAPDSSIKDEFYFKLEDVVLYDSDGDPDTKDDQIKANGAIRLKRTFTLDLVIQDWEVQRLSFTSYTSDVVELKISSQVNLAGLELEKQVARHTFHPITAMIGWVPVEIVPVLVINVGVDGSVHVGVTTGVEQQATTTSNWRYDNGIWRTSSSHSDEFHFTPPTPSAGLDLKGYVNGELSLLLYGVVGPHANLEAYLQLEADVFAVPWWQLYAGLEGSGGVKVEVFGKNLVDYQPPLVIGYKLLLAEAQSNTPPEMPYQPFPADQAILQDLNADLSWQGGDLDGDPVSYDIYLEANDSQPDLLVADDQTGTTFDPGTLLANTHYYWRVVAQDGPGAVTASPVWEFTTASGATCPIDLVLGEQQVNDLTVTIPGTVSSACSTITGLYWQWGDGVGTIQEFPASHTYAETGAYPITVTAYNDLGDHQVATTTAYVGYQREGMIFIPPGEFWMGCANDSLEYCLYSDEQPMHTVYLDAYFIDKYEVTNGQYAQCVSAGVCNPPLYDDIIGIGGYFNNPAYADYPVLWLNWFDAQAYCAWAGKRLPTEAEWEKAARGTDRRILPWGNQTVDCSLANYGGVWFTCVGHPTRVGSYPNGASYYGALDMAGNVIEWVSDWYDPVYYSISPYSNPTGPASGTEKVMRGGDWASFAYDVKTDKRAHELPDDNRAYSGFRCAASIP